VLLLSLLRRAVREDFLHLLCGLEVGDPGTLRSLLNIGDLGGVLSAEQLRLHVFRRLQVVDVGDEDTLRFRLGLVRRLAWLVGTVGRCRILVLIGV
jgi:hypothetical protein